jgi:DNA-binding transcriptional LysR family regulator
VPNVTNVTNETHRAPADVGAATPHAPALRLSLPELEAFLMVAKCGSISQAARELHITQPAVTTRVLRLESGLKTRLLERTSRGVHCTPAGLRLFASAEGALSGLRTLVRDLMEEAEAARHVVTVTVTPATASIVLPPLLREFSIRYPNTSIEVRDVDRDHVLAAVRAGAVDFGITAVEVQEPALVMQKFVELPFVLVAPADSPLVAKQVVGFEDLENCVIVELNDHAHLNAQLNAEFAKRSIKFRTLKTQNLATLLGMVNAGFGLSFIAETALSSGAAGNVRRLQLPEFSYLRTLWLVRQRRPLKNASRTFWDFMLQEGARLSAKV